MLQASGACEVGVAFIFELLVQSIGMPSLCCTCHRFVGKILTCVGRRVRTGRCQMPEVTGKLMLFVCVSDRLQCSMQTWLGAESICSRAVGCL